MTTANSQLMERIQVLEDEVKLSTKKFSDESICGVDNET